MRFCRVRSDVRSVASISPSSSNRSRKAFSVSVKGRTTYRASLHSSTSYVPYFSGEYLSFDIWRVRLSVESTLYDRFLNT